MGGRDDPRSDNFNGHNAAINVTAAVPLFADQAYDVKLEYFEETKSAVMMLGWQPPGITTVSPIPAERLRPTVGPGGLLGQYFGNDALTGAPLVTHVEPVNYDWQYGPPEAGLPSESFSVVLDRRGATAPATGSYILETLSDDGVRLWLGGQLVIDNWPKHSAKINRASPIALTAGQRLSVDGGVRLHRTGAAIIRLRWQTPVATATIPIPRAQLDAN